MTRNTCPDLLHPGFRFPETKDSIGPSGKRGLSFLVHLSATDSLFFHCLQLRGR